MKKIIFLLLMSWNGISGLCGMESFENPYMQIMNISEKKNICADISEEVQFPIPLRVVPIKCSWEQEKDLCVSSVIIKKELLEIIENQYQKGRDEKIKENKNNDKYECSRLDCMYTTNHQSRITSHEKMHQIKTTSLRKVYTCEICGFLTIAKRTFEDHEQTHENKTQYECLVDGCSIRTPTRKRMEWHWHDKHNKNGKSDMPNEKRYRQLK